MDLHHRDGAWKVGNLSAARTHNADFLATMTRSKNGALPYRRALLLLLFDHAQCIASRARFLERLIVGFASPDAQHALETRDKDFSVADLTGLGGVDDRFHHLIDEAVLDRYLDAGFRNEIDHVLSTAIQLGVAALTPKAFYF